MSKKPKYRIAAGSQENFYIEQKFGFFTWKILGNQRTYDSDTFRPTYYENVEGADDAIHKWSSKTSLTDTKDRQTRHQGNRVVKTYK